MRAETYQLVMNSLWKFGSCKDNGLFHYDEEDGRTGWVNYITKSETKESESKDLFIDVENMTL